MGHDKQKLGRNVAARRKRAGWTQAQLAEKICVATETVGRLETGAAIPSLERIGDVARALGVELYELFRYRSGDTDEEHALDRLMHVAATRSAAEIELICGLTTMIFGHIEKGRPREPRVRPLGG